MVVMMLMLMLMPMEDQQTTVVIFVQVAQALAEVVMIRSATAPIEESKPSFRLPPAPMKKMRLLLLMHPRALVPSGLVLTVQSRMGGQEGEEEEEEEEEGTIGRRKEREVLNVLLHFSDLVCPLLRLQEDIQVPLARTTIRTVHLPIIVSMIVVIFSFQSILFLLFAWTATLLVIYSIVGSISPFALSPLVFVPIIDLEYEYVLNT